jgi:hypothetical protein
MSIEMRGLLSMIAQKFHLGRKLGEQGRLVPRPSAMQERKQTADSSEAALPIE